MAVQLLSINSRAGERVALHHKNEPVSSWVIRLRLCLLCLLVVGVAAIELQEDWL
jgi:hypothetical protein